jgi:hypothetical protein
MPELAEVAQWVGNRVDDVYGARVGRVEDVYVDPETGSPHWLLAKISRFGEDHALVPVDDTIAGAGHVWVPYERELIKRSGQHGKGTPLHKERELELCSLFGVPARADEVAGRLNGSITSYSFAATSVGTR